MLQPPRIHIIGRKNAGKTTLVCELLQILNSRGIRTASVKHTHHHHELDTPGKDSHQHREAGAAAVGILSPQVTALFLPLDRSAQPEADRYKAFASAFSDCQLILVEGDQHTTAPRIEVWRKDCNQPPIAATEPGLLALVTDHSPPPAHCPVIPRSPLEHVLQLILNHITHHPNQEPALQPHEA
jgi:molybdopterin-guanine dinucleotide biosynthesis protein MobB